jgi:hypothetical protein
MWNAEVYVGAHQTEVQNFYRLWTVSTKAKTCLKYCFRETERRRKLTTQKGQLFAIKYCDVQDVHLLSTAHDDWMAETLNIERTS